MADGPVARSTEAGSALRSVVPRLTELIRSITRPTAPAIGEWNVGDVAGRIDVAAAQFLDMLASSTGDELSPWLISGIKVPIDTFACHLLNESLVHGDDIARAERTAWPIEPAHAAVVLTGFVFPMLGKVDPRSVVHQDKAAGVHACYEIHVRRSGRVYLFIDDGSLSIAPSSSRKVDCHVSADPTALLLVIWARRSQWRAVLTARITSWGLRPWLGPRLRTMLKNP
jgi:hypothetical protein